MQYLHEKSSHIYFKCKKENKLFMTGLREAVLLFSSSFNYLFAFCRKIPPTLIKKYLLKLIKMLNLAVLGGVTVKGTGVGLSNMIFFYSVYNNEFENFEFFQNFFSFERKLAQVTLI
jgi:hypothetical protein